MRSSEWAQIQEDWWSREKRGEQDTRRHRGEAAGRHGGGRRLQANQSSLRRSKPDPTLIPDSRPPQPKVRFGCLSCPVCGMWYAYIFFLFNNLLLLLVQTKSAKASWCYPLSPMRGFLGLASMLLLKATQRVRFCISFPYYFQFCCLKFPPFLGQCLSFL